MIAQTRSVCLHCCGTRITLRKRDFARVLRPRPLARLPYSATGGGRLAPSRAVPALGRALRANKKGTPKGAFGVSGSARTSNYTPRSPNRPWRLALRAMLRLCRNARGATFAALLTSKLADSALLGYLHRHLQSKWRCSSFEPLSNGKRAHPTRGYALFLAEKERLELSRRV